jgi:hypothetical protein
MKATYKYLYFAVLNTPTFCHLLSVSKFPSFIAIYLTEDVFFQVSASFPLTSRTLNVPAFALTAGIR